MGDPVGGAQQDRRDQRFGIAERVERAEGEAEVFGGDEVEDGAPVVGLPDEDEVALCREHVGHSAPEHRLAVGDEHAGCSVRHAPIMAPRGRRRGGTGKPVPPLRECAGQDAAEAGPCALSEMRRRP